jgi:two-component system, chemotaxis family, protein-glutamate methylesterase/glutaminase
MIRVLVVDDSPSFVSFIQEVLNNEEDIQVVGVAKHGMQAVSLAKKLNPDVITMDILMPQLDGVEAIRHIMAKHPTRIIVLSALVDEKRAGKVFTALANGALEALDKNFAEDGIVVQEKVDALVECVRTCAKIRVIRHSLMNVENTLSKIKKRRTGKLPSSEKDRGYYSNRVIGIVSSTGGPEALIKIVSKFPSSFPVPILLVQHIASGFSAGFVKWLGNYTDLTVKIAEHGEDVVPRTIYVGEAGRHLEVGLNRQLSVVEADAKDLYKPSGDRLLSSIAATYGRRALGVILTGMGKDGSKGLNDIYQRGGHAIAQNEASSLVYGMPKAAIDLECVHDVVDLDEITSYILKWQDPNKA